MLTLSEKPRERKAYKPKCRIRKWFKDPKPLYHKLMFHCVNILRMEVRSHNCHRVFVQVWDYFIYAARSESRQIQCTGLYLVDKVVHQQVVLYDSGCELLIIHHILKEIVSWITQHNPEQNARMNVWWSHTNYWSLKDNEKEGKSLPKISVSSSASFALLANLSLWLLVLSPWQAGESGLRHFALRSAGGCTV